MEQFFLRKFFATFMFEASPDSTMYFFSLAVDLLPIK